MAPKEELLERWCLQVSWQLGSSVFGLLLRKYAPSDTYQVCTAASRTCGTFLSTACELCCMCPVYILSASGVGIPQFACAGETPNAVLDALHESAMAKIDEASYKLPNSVYINLFYL